MSTTNVRAIVVVTSAVDARLGGELQLLIHGWPAEDVHQISAETPDGTPVTDIVSRATSASYVIVQENLRSTSPIQIAAVAAARASKAQLLLLCPSGLAITPLMRLADAQPSQVLFYPVNRESDSEWAQFRVDLGIRKGEIDVALRQVERSEQLRPITARLTNNAAILNDASPTEAVAVTIARVFDLHTSSVRLENHVDFLQLDFPVNLYTDLLRHLTRTFSRVRTIADPVSEELQWDNPVNRNALAAVSERVFALDTEHAHQFGIEGVLDQLHPAMGAGGTVSVFALPNELRIALVHGSPVNRSLRGINRFYAGDNIVGGYTDDTATNVRMLAFHTTEHHRAVYERELDLLQHVDRLKQVPPSDRPVDRTELASWLYTNVFTPPPSLNAIYNHEADEYATEYDGNIVRVTPGYYRQLDLLASEVKRALAALYSPYTGRGRKNIRLLELGFGTGAMTGRLVSVTNDFITHIWSDEDDTGRSFIEFDAWDSNRKMVEIALSRIAVSPSWSRATAHTRPSLRHHEFDPNKADPGMAPYDLVVGSLSSHYWMDFRPNRPVTRPGELREFRAFLGAVRDELVTPGGIAMFLDVFPTSDKRTAEFTAWREYLERELGDKEAADSYLSRNPWQYHAASKEIVSEVALDCGYQVWWRETLPGLPFRILTLATPQETPDSAGR